MKQVTVKTSDAIKTVCQCCGHTFIPTKNTHYIAKEFPQAYIIQLVEPGLKQYDAFDCPNCGCQIIAGERLKPVDEAVFALGDIDEVHENGKEDDSDAEVDKQPSSEGEESD